MAQVDLEDIGYTLGTTQILRNVSLTIAEGECLALLGPSGCGKTTTLRCIAGFVVPTRGNVRIGGESVVNLRPHQRNVGLVFQDYALFPHMSVHQNIAYGLERRKIGKAELTKRVDELVALTHLEGLEERRPDQLSGGQRQRVALARALVIKPDVLLLDEPLGALDRLLREQMQVELKRIQQDLGITTVIVTHDQEEALSVSDRIAVMFDGRIVETGLPEQLYHAPEQRGVMSFLGSSNIWQATVDAADGPYLQLSRGDFRFFVSAKARLPEGAAAHVGIRPEHIRISTEPPADAINVVSGRIETTVYKGAHVEVYVATAAGIEFLARQPAASKARGSGSKTGDQVFLTFDPENAMLFPSEG